MKPNHKLEEYLEDHRVPFEILSHDHTTNSMQTAQSAHVEPGRLVKAVLLEGDDCFMAALIPADHEIRLARLAQDYGPHVHLADESAIKSVFPDCEPGVVPGLPVAWGIDTVWDDDLLAEPDIYLDAGDHQRLIHVETRHLRDVIRDMPHCHFSGPRKQH
jgi:Ala-tRNA(Pro) deacylase